MSEKTEQPTQKRLRDARQKGQVCKSQEVSATATLLTVFAVFLGAGPFLWESLLVMFEAPLRHMHLPFREAVSLTMEILAMQAAIIVALVLGTAIVAGTGAGIVQIGVLFSAKGATPSLEKLNPQQWVKKTFAVKNLVELLKNVCKILIISYVVRVTLEDNVGRLLSIPHGGLGGIAPAAGAVFMDLIMNTAPAFVVIAAVDFWYQRHEYIKGLKMTKDEVKREYKEMEGDPLIKGKRKQLHQEMAMSSTLAQVRKASVVVTNPTRIAVAIQYEKEETPLPVIVGMGEGLLARRILEIAKEEGIPVMQNVPLARALLEQGREQHYIPEDLILPVAEVLRWAQTLKKA